MISFSILFSILWKPTSVGTPTEAVLKPESDVAVVAAAGTHNVQSAAVLNAFVTLSQLLLMSLLWMLLLRMMFIVHMGTI